MATFKTHLSVLKESAWTWPTRPVFRVPQIASDGEQVEDWNVITYSQFDQEVELYARYWARVLSADGILPRSIIGLW